MSGRDQAIEVSLTWGTGPSACVLSVARLRPGERFRLDDADVVSWDTAPCVVPPPEAYVSVEGRPVSSERVPLRPGEVVDVSVGVLTVRAQLVAREPWEAPSEVGARRWITGLPRGIALSALAHLLGAMLLAHAPRPTAANGEITPEQIATMRALLEASAAHAPPDTRLDRSAALREARRERAAVVPPVERGASDPPSPVAAPSPTVVAGPAETRRAEIAEAKGFGAIGLLQALAIDPNEPSPWKEATASLGAHEAAMHALFDAPTIDKTGIGGLTLSGVGSGGGGKSGLVFDDADADAGPSHPPSWTRWIEAMPPVPDHPLPGRGALGPGRAADAVLAETRQARSVIRGIIQANEARVHACYESGLRRDPGLAGRVVVDFTIGEGGAVVSAKDEGSDLADPAVRGCIVRVIYSLGFAAPKGGPVTVKYPFVLRPGE